MKWLVVLLTLLTASAAANGIFDDKWVKKTASRTLGQETLKSLSDGGKTLETIAGDNEKSTAQKAIVLPNDPVIDADFSCNQSLLSSYGLTGVPKPSSVPTASCPSSKQTCCSAADDQTSLLLWEKNRKHVEDQYNVFLAFLRYTLGLAAEATKVAKDSTDSKNDDCRIAAADFIQLNMTPDNAKYIYKSIVNSVKSLANIRKGFYCSICDTEFQEQLQHYWTFNAQNFRSNLFISQDNCYKLVNATIEGSFFQVSYLKRYLEDLVMVMNCKTGESAKPQLNFDFAVRQKIKNCYFFRNKHFFYYCQSYCNDFSLIEKNAVFDGNLVDFQAFFKAVSNGREKAFEGSGKNELGSDSDDEKLLKSSFEETIAQESFFDLEQQKGVNLAGLTTKFVVVKGADFVLPTIDNKYKISIKNAFALLAGVAFSLLALY